MPSSGTSSCRRGGPRPLLQLREQQPLPVSEPVHSLCEEVLEGPSLHMPPAPPPPGQALLPAPSQDGPGLRLPVTPVAGPRDRGAGQPRSHTRPRAAVAGSPALGTVTAGERSLALPPPKTSRPFSEMHPHARGCSGNLEAKSYFSSSCKSCSFDRFSSLGVNILGS